MLSEMGFINPTRKTKGYDRDYTVHAQFKYSTFQIEVLYC